MKIYATIPEMIGQQLEQVALKHHCSVSAVIRRAVFEWLKSNKKDSETVENSPKAPVS